MALDNLISVSFSEEELRRLDDALGVIEEIFKGRLISLTHEQRKEYGRLADRNHPWVVKTDEFIKLKPAIVPAFINKEEWDVDLKTDNQLRPRMRRINAIHSQMDDAMLLIGHDLYFNSLAYYRSIKVNAQNGLLDAKPIYEDLVQRCQGYSRKKSSSEPTP